MSKLFAKYRQKLSKQSWAKSIICGLIVGFTLMFITALIFWLIDFNKFYLIIISFIVGSSTIPLFYFKRFKPTQKEVANKIDELGLEERVVTMSELENDNSFIAQKQREDTLKSLNSISPSLLKLVISIPMILILSFSILLGGGMTTVVALADRGVIDNGKEVIDSIIPSKTNFYTVEYLVEGVGEIEGDIVQNIEPGKNGSQVTAIAIDGYVFWKWSDGLEDPVRTELNVKEDKSITAIFVELEEDPDNTDGDGNDSSPDEEIPTDPGEGEPKPGSGNSDEEGQQGTGGGGNRDINKFGNGEKDYKDFWNESKADADSNMEGKDSDTKRTVEDYFNNIKN